MVLATKRAVGSDYSYPIYENIAVREQKTKTRAKKRPSPLVGIAIISLLFMMGISYTFLQAVKAHLIWQTSQTKQTIAAMQMNNEKLKLEVAKLKSLDRIEQIAASQLQMVKNPGIEYVAFQGGISTNQNSEVPAVASADSGQNATAQASFIQRNNLIQSIVAAWGKGMLAKG